MSFNGQKLKAKFQKYREERRKERERAAGVRTAAREAYLKEEKTQEIVFAKKRAQFKVQEEFKQYKARVARPSVVKKAGDFFGNLQVQPMGSASGFEGSAFGSQKQQGVDMNFFGSMFGAPQRQAPKKRRRKKKSKKRKKK